LTGSWWQVLGTGGKQNRVSRVDLTAADLVGARRREPAGVTRVYAAYAPALFRFFMAAVGDRPTAEDLTGKVVDPEELALDRVEGDRVLAALRQLTPDQRELLLLRLAADLIAPEVARILNKSTEAVKALQVALGPLRGARTWTAGPRLVHIPSEPSGSQRSPAVRHSRKWQVGSRGTGPAAER
jgi:hypothetical protein